LTIRERIDKLIEMAEKEKEYNRKSPPNPSYDYWNGFIAFGNELKLTVKPSERSIDDEPS